MELATGRGAVSSKEPSSVRNGGGNDGSESGRSGSGRVRESDYSYRSSVADDGRRDRHYTRDGAGGVGGGRGRDRDRDWKDWGASNAGDKQLPRWRGSSDSGRSGSSRHYVGGGDVRDKGYRYHSHHRDRTSRSPPPTDRNKRPKVSAGNSPMSGIGNGAGIGSGSRRDVRDKDRSGSRSARDRGSRSGGLDGVGGSGTRSSSEQRYRGSGGGRRSGGGGGSRGGDRPVTAAGSSGRRLGDLREDSATNGSIVGGGGGGGGSSSGGRSRSIDTPHSGSRSSGSNSGDDATVGDLRHPAEVGNGGSSSSNGRYLRYSPAGGGGSGGRGGAMGDRKSFPPPVSGTATDAEEEGEVLLSTSEALAGSSVVVAVATAVATAAPLRSPSRGRRYQYSPSGGARERRGNDGADESGDRGDGDDYPSRKPTAGVSPGVRRREDEGEGRGRGSGGAIDDGGVLGSERPRRAGKDRWADSDSEDEEDEGGKGGSAESRKANGAAGSGRADAGGHGKGASGAQEVKRHKISGSGGAGARDRLADGESAAAASSLSGALDMVGPSSKSAAEELHQAMMTSGIGTEEFFRANEAGEHAVAGGGFGGAVGGQDKRSILPLTVFTRDLAEEDTYNPLLFGSRSVDHFERIRFIDEGAYGKVYCALNKGTSQVVALKQVKLTRDNGKEGFPITALRETNVLLSLHHPNIVRVLEMVVGSTLDKVYMVMEYFDHDLKSVMHHLRKEKRFFTLGQVKSLVQQLLRAVEYMHRHWYIHRDLKTSNLLYNHQGKLAVCDFGLARKYADPIRPYTSNVVTQWYRCPELLLGKTEYSTGVDTWSVGCIFGELVKGAPMFQGKTEIDQLNKIFGVMGAPTEKRWPGWSKLPLASKMDWRHGKDSRLRTTFPTTGFSGQASISDQGLDLMDGLLTLDPSKRTSAKDALDHRWFTSEKPLPTPAGEMPQVDSCLDTPINEALAKWAKAQVGKPVRAGGGNLLGPRRREDLP